jgi:drug/metabolite transporter (DMT)-like permease
MDTILSWLADPKVWLGAVLAFIAGMIRTYLVRWLDKRSERRSERRSREAAREGVRLVDMAHEGDSALQARWVDSVAAISMGLGCMMVAVFGWLLTAAARSTSPPFDVLMTLACMSIFIAGIAAIESGRHALAMVSTVLRGGDQLRDLRAQHADDWARLRSDLGLPRKIRHKPKMAKWMRRNESRGE